MSLSELILAIIVGIFVLKPEDIRLIMIKIKEFGVFVNSVKQEIVSYIDSKDYALPNDIKDETEQVNFYLKKIYDLDSQYRGEYSLSLIKEHYNKLVRDKIEQDERMMDNEK